MATYEEVCEIKPVEAFLSTNLNNRNKTFDDLANKIMYQLGYPTITVELHKNQVYSAIQNAIEFFTKYAGFTEEYLIFDSRIYDHNKGIRLDKLCTLASQASAREHSVNPEQFKKNYDVTLEVPKRNYVVNKKFNGQDYGLQGQDGRIFKKFEVLTAEDYDRITTASPNTAEFFTIDRDSDFTMEGKRQEEQPEQFENAYDYDLMDYRKVCEVVDYQESSNRNLTSLFSFESALASQAYYTYQFSLKGFDLLSFHTLHEFLKTRDRTLALTRTYKFNPRTQQFYLMPQPREGMHFFAVILCRIERPLRDIIDRYWIYKYALAQCKMMLGMIRGRFGQVQLAGGAVLADNNNLREMGAKEMEDLEKELMDGTAFSEKTPPLFFIG